MSTSPPQDSFVRSATITLLVYAVLLALVTFLSRQTRMQATEASDASRSAATTYTSVHTMMSLRESRWTGCSDMLNEMWNDQAQRMKPEVEAASKEDWKQLNIRSTLNHKSTRYEYSIFTLQAAVALVTVSLFKRTKAMFYGSFLLGFGGVAMLIVAHFLTA